MSAPLYCYYGDDFTGSTDVLEALATAGLRSVLFLGVPSEEHRLKFADCQAFGIAGDSRSRSPEWMDAHLPSIFAQLRSFGAPVVHYKTCSTFDSSPQTGSIGRAMEIALSLYASGHGAYSRVASERDALHLSFIPIVVAAPHLRRYVVFGNLFAAAGDQVFRIDRHPTMRQHPVTPMHEADLRRHLAQQTLTRVGLIDLPTLQSGTAEHALTLELADGNQAVLFDGVAERDLQEAGRLIWHRAQTTPLFAVGSSGLTYSLVAAWRAAGATLAEIDTHEPSAPTSNRQLGAPPGRGATLEPAKSSNPTRCKASHGDSASPSARSSRAAASYKNAAVAQMLVISGSCSPTTERQIKHALNNGYEGVAVDPTELLSDNAGTSANRETSQGRSRTALASAQLETHEISACPTAEAHDQSVHTSAAAESGGKPVRTMSPAEPRNPAFRMCVEKAIVGLRGNGKVVVYTSLGALPPGVAARGDALGRQLGTMLREIISATGVRRVVLAGGDTSSHAVSQLGLYALTWAAAVQPGAPLCRAHSDSPKLDGLELVLKGGQVGTEDFFERARTLGDR